MSIWHFYVNMIGNTKDSGHSLTQSTCMLTCSRVYLCELRTLLHLIIWMAYNVWNICTFLWYSLFSQRFMVSVLTIVIGLVPGKSHLTMCTKLTSTKPLQLIPNRTLSAQFLGYNVWTLHGVTVRIWDKLASSNLDYMLGHTYICM